MSCAVNDLVTDDVVSQTYLLSGYDLYALLHSSDKVKQAIFDQIQFPYDVETRKIDLSLLPSAI